MHPPNGFEAVMADLQLLRSKDVLVATRTKMVNHIRGCMKRFGLRLPSVATSTFPRVAAPIITRNLSPSLVPMLRMIAELTTRIRESERRIDRLCAKRYPQTAALRQVNGVGPVTALTFMLTARIPLALPRVEMWVPTWESDPSSASRAGVTLSSASARPGS